MSIAQSTHPDYMALLDSWKKYRLVEEGGDDFIAAYLESYSDRESTPDFNTILTDMDISNVKCRNIPPTGPNKVDRYRFIVDFTVSYYWDRSLT